MDAYDQPGMDDPYGTGTRPPSGMQPVSNQPPDFMQWLFSFREQVVEPLKYIWRGMEMNEKGEWIPIKGGRQLMNDKGITWAISLIESYINPVFIVSNFDEKAYNARMRILTKFVINSLCLRYREFNIHKSDIPRILDEIESKVQAVLLGARGDGYRRFLGTVRQVQDIKHTTNEQSQPSRGGMFNLGMFKKNQNMY